MLIYSDSSGRANSTLIVLFCTLHLSTFEISILVPTIINNNFELLGKLAAELYNALIAAACR